MPLFVLAFVAAAALRSAGLVPSGLLPVLADAKTVLLAVALFAVGARVELRRLLAVGGRPLVLGLSSWVIVALVAYVGSDGGVVVSRPTMRDVAGQAGVSLQTVSNYVNGRLNLMSVETRERVGRELDRLGYWPNAAARSLRAKRTMTLGFLVLDEGARFLADPMTDLIIAGIGDVARDNGYSLLIQAARPEPDDVDRLFSPLLEERVDGAFLFLSGSPSVRRRTIRRVDELGSNFVVFEQAPAGVPVVSVTAENRAGARQLAEHLLERGHRRIAFVATRTPWPMVEERLRGYRDALAAPVAAPELAGRRRSGSGGRRRMAERLLELDEPPTAIMCGNDLLALGALQAARLRGLRVPGDVAVTGFNDFEFAQYADPPLTTVRVPGYDLGRIGAESLVARIGGELPPAGGERLTLPVRSGCAARRDGRRSGSETDRIQSPARAIASISTSIPLPRPAWTVVRTAGMSGMYASYAAFIAA